MEVYPLVNIQKAIEHGPVEIVDLSIYSMVDLSMVFVCLEGKSRDTYTKWDDTWIIFG